MTESLGVTPPPEPNDSFEPEEDEVEPVELLVQLAKQGDIDPWDVDIVTVTDEFLAALDDGDLRTSGRALFYASVLLRMKSDAMLADDDASEEPEQELDPAPPWEDAEWDQGGEGAPEGDPIEALESEMDRRLDRKSARGTPMTLDELVRDLREAERGTWWKESRTYDTTNSPKGFSRGVQTLDYRTGDDMREEGEPDADEVTGTAHQENIDELIDAVLSRLLREYRNGREEVLFVEIANAAGSRIETFLALLFLDHRGEVALQQDELFGDLWIVDPNAEPPAGGDDDDPGSDDDASSDDGASSDDVANDEEGSEERGR
ncbi:MAG: segregation/condensation protein A [Halanaeroarchaeum sp.]